MSLACAGVAYRGALSEMLRRPAWSLVQGGALHRQQGLELWNLPPALRPADSRRAR
jgi:hypothetical protein